MSNEKINDINLINKRISIFRILYIVFFYLSFTIIIFALGVFSYISILFGNTSSSKNNKQHESSEFIYEIRDIRAIFSYSKDVMTITNFNKDIYDEKVIVIPSNIDGIKVDRIDKNLFNNSDKALNKVEYIILDYEPREQEAIEVNCYSLKKIFCNYELKNSIELIMNDDVNVIYLGSKDKVANPKGDYIKSANVIYYDLLLEENTSQIYFYDFYDDELIDYIPPVPVHEGYTFKGWYKDKDLTEEWDFSVDIIPGSFIEGITRYYDVTSLYAKFEENNN